MKTSKVSLSKSYLEGFRKYIRDAFGDVTGRVFCQPIHLTTVTSYPNHAVTVYFAIYRHSERIELASYVTFEYVGSRKQVGVTVIDGRYYAFDWEGESGRLFECVLS